MKFSGWLVIVAILLPVQASDADVLINELFVNAPGGDNGREFLELRGSNNFSLLDHWFLAVDGDGSAAGTVKHALDLGSFSLGSNGLFVWRDAASGSPAAGTAVHTEDFSPDIENGTNTFLLVTDFSGSVGDDLDAANSGTLDSTPWSSVVDALAWTDGGSSDRMYAGLLGGPEIDTGQFTPDLGFRDRLSRNWFFSDVVDPGESFDPSEFADQNGVVVDPNSLGFDFQTTSLGNFNPTSIPEPANGLALLIVAAGLACRKNRDRSS